MQKVNFHKYSACGNDFIVIDNRRLCLPISPQLIAQLCQRRTGIGADGIILLNSSTRADFRMRIFNADGSEAEMCGNGIRCLLPFLHAQGVRGSSFHIETMERILRISDREGAVAVEMGLAQDIRWHLSIPLDGATQTGHYLNTGVPHLVIFVDSVDRIDIQREGGLLRHHPLFKPSGTNVNFVERRESGLVLRTYERGVEGETLACGTGATAAALALTQMTGASSPICVLTRSGESLRIAFRREGDQFHQIELCGPARCIYQGEVTL